MPRDNNMYDCIPLLSSRHAAYNSPLVIIHMKTRTTILTILFFSTILTTNLSSQIKNGGFEFWDTIKIQGSTDRYFEIPRNWHTTNRLTENLITISTPVTKDTNSVSGKYSAKIESNDWGLDSKYPGIMDQSMSVNYIEKISYKCKCDSLWMNASCITQVIDKLTNEIVYSDSIKSVAEEFNMYEIYKDDLQSIVGDSIILRFIAQGKNGIIDYDEVGYSVMLVDEIFVEYILSDKEPEINFEMYPNPFKNEIVIMADKLINIKIFNSENVLAKNITKTKFEIINTTDLTKGLYIIKLEYQGREIIKKMIKV